MLQPETIMTVKILESQHALEQLEEEKKEAVSWIQNQTKEDIKEILSEANDKTLVFVHKNSKLEEPFEILMERHSNHMETLNEDILLIFTQNEIEEAKEILIEKNLKTMNTASDEVLVFMVQKNSYYSKDAKEILVKRYMPFLHSFVVGRFFLPGHETEDLVSEATYGLIRAINDYRIEKKKRFRGFTKTVIERHMGTLIKRLTNGKNQMLNESFSYHNPVDKDNEVTFEQTLKTERFDPEEMFFNSIMLKELIELFSPLEKKVLKPYSKGYTYDEIAEKLGIERKSVDNTIQRFRKKKNIYLAIHYYKEGYSVSDIAKNLKINKVEDVEEILRKYKKNKNSELKNGKK